jgi:uncharacterized repeat protein (TIGR03803 family)
MKKPAIILLISAAALTIAFPDYSYSYELLHEFAGGDNDGDSPLWGRLVFDSGKLYGMTEGGGDSSSGVIFSMQPDGTGFTLLHEFAGGSDDGRFPPGCLILDSGVLYGMTREGGDSDQGTVFSISTDGTGFTLLHEFAGGVGDGSLPYGSLIFDSGKLYGMTSQGGGDPAVGTIFSISSDGTGFALLHEFAGGVDDGSSPFGSFIIDAGKLYGMTFSGGDSNQGTIFSINANGTNFTLLHEFAGGVDDGSSPYGSLIFNSGKLYGMTYYGGDSNLGTIFSISSDGTGFALLHEFAGGVDDGSSPYGSLLFESGRLYGMTSKGGDSDKGTIFSMKADGTRFTLLHEFAGGVNDGSNPIGSLALHSGKLYGMTRYGGNSDYGTIFSMPLPIPKPAISSLVPHSGSTRGSDQILIIGENFDATATVKFGDGTATVVKWIDDSHLQVETPPHAAGYVDVTVTDSSGATAVLTQGFLYVPPPEVNNIYPESGSWRGGTGVTITGSNFWTGARVFFGGIRARVVQVVDSGTILAVTPAMPPGTVTVEVQNPPPTGQSSAGQPAPVEFTFVLSGGHDGGCSYMPGGGYSLGQIALLGIAVVGFIAHRWRWKRR